MMYMLQVKIKFRLKNVQPRLILYFLCLWAVTIHELGLEDKGNWKSIYVKKFLTYRRFNFDL